MIFILGLVKTIIKTAFILNEFDLIFNLKQFFFYLFKKDQCSVIYIIIFSVKRKAQFLRQQYTAVRIWDGGGQSRPSLPNLVELQSCAKKVHKMALVEVGVSFP